MLVYNSVKQCETHNLHKATDKYLSQKHNIRVEGQTAGEEPELG